MTPADAVRDALAPLALAGYDATPSGLVQALADLGEARSLLAAWLDGDETCATLQRARAWVDARRAEQAAPTYQRFVGVDHGKPGGSYEVVMERRPDGWSLIRGALQPPTDPPPSADYVGPGWADGVPRGA